MYLIAKYREFLIRPAERLYPGESILQEQNERLDEAWPAASTYWFIHSDVLAHVGCRFVDRLACKVQIEFLPQERSQEPAMASPDRRMRHH